MKRLAIFLGFLMLTPTSLLAFQQYADDEHTVLYFDCKVYCTPYNDPTNAKIMASGRSMAADQANASRYLICGGKPGTQRTNREDCKKTDE